MEEGARREGEGNEREASARTERDCLRCDLRSAEKGAEMPMSLADQTRPGCG